MAAGNERFSLKDHLFNARTVGQLASEYAMVPGFDAGAFKRAALAGLEGRELMQRVEWLADCIEAQLSPDFPRMAAQVEIAMPAPLDPALQDDDFGQFIHAVPGILAVRHGLEAHRERALDLLHSATQRFSMEFYIRPFLNRWPEETLARLTRWAKDDNYHVRRLVSEGTRPRLPWAKAVTLSPDQVWPLLDALHADRTRYVTRSVANHLNDLSRIVPNEILERLSLWKKEKRQASAELAWTTRHALRTLIKQGHVGAMEALGYTPDAPMDVSLNIPSDPVRIGEVLHIECEILTETALPVLVDYRITFARPGGKQVEKVFKLRQVRTAGGTPLVLTKRHRLKADATTFTLHPGAHRLVVQVNGVDRAEAPFDLI